MIEREVLGYDREPTLGTSATRGYTAERQENVKVRDRDDCRKPRDKPFYWGGVEWGIGDSFTWGNNPELQRKWCGA